MRRHTLLPAVAAAALVASALSISPAWSSPPDLPPAAGSGIAAGDELTGSVESALAEADGPVTAFVQLDTPSALDVTEAGGSPAAAQQAAAVVEDVAADVVPAEAATTSNAATPQRIATLTNLVAGTLVSGDAAKVRALADDPAVVAVYLVAQREPTNASSDAFTQALATWQSLGYTGEGITVGVIDSGLDYTHTDFGGPGTAEAFEAAYGADGTGPIPAGSFDPTKFAGGIDFAGPTYGTTGNAVQDPNPIELTDGHGTHVAGTVAGWGVLADGSTYRGDYETLTDLSAFLIGPGTAPDARLFSLKVFGDDGGTTGLSALALDYAADPNDDGDFSDHLDIVNLSLGASGAPADDPESLLINRLAEIGTLAVISAGNSGDANDIAGSPGNSTAALTVANSVGGPILFDVAETLDADGNVTGSYPGQNSIAYTGEDVTAPVAYLGARVDGCSSLASRSAEITGKIVWLWWNDDDTSRRCGSVARFTNAANAGAAGVIIGTEGTVFVAGISGTDTIPGIQLTDIATDAFEPLAAAGGLVAHIGPGQVAKYSTDVLADVLNPGSSRGGHGSLGSSKPDVAAPGTAIRSAASATGSGVATFSGTSMAAPHVSGITALVRQAHPEWTPAEVKAAVVNTATHDLTTAPGGAGEVYGPERVGSGRVDALAAVTDQVLAYNADSPSTVSVSFGVVDVGSSTVTATKKVTVQNLGSAASTWQTSVTTTNTAGGATITASPASVTVPAGGTATVTLTLTADPTTLTRDLDPTSEATQAGLPREYVTSVAGRLVLTSGDSELRVPVQAAPRLVSDISAAPVVFDSTTAASAPLTLSGTGVASGGWESLVAPTILAATSPVLPPLDGSIHTSASALASGDIRSVGWVSTAPQSGTTSEGYLGVAIATEGPWATLGLSTQPVIDIDVDNDGSYDYETVIQKYKEETDITVAVTFDYRTGATVAIDPVNGFFGDVDTTVFDKTVVLAPISLAALGVTPGEQPRLSVWTYSQYAVNGVTVDSVPDFTVDPYAPPVWFEAAVPDVLWWSGQPNTTIGVHRSEATLATQLLVLHSHNVTGKQAQVVDLRVAGTKATVTTVKAPGKTRAGQVANVSAVVTSSKATGTVTFLDNGTAVATAPVVKGKAASTFTPTTAGTHLITASFTPTAGSDWAASTSQPVKVAVAKANSAVSTVLSHNSGKVGAPVALTIRVKGDGVIPTGTIHVSDGKKWLLDVVLTPSDIKSGTLAVVTVDLPRTLSVGSHTIVTNYAGSVDVKGATTQRVYRVIR